MKRAILPLVAIAALLICGCMQSANQDIPENYYFKMKKADVNSPVELIRFAASIRPIPRISPLRRGWPSLNGTSRIAASMSALPIPATFTTAGGSMSGWS